MDALNCSPLNPALFRHIWDRVQPDDTCDGILPTAELSCPRPDCELSHFLRRMLQEEHHQHRLCQRLMCRCCLRSAACCLAEDNCQRIRALSALLYPEQAEACCPSDCDDEEQLRVGCLLKELYQCSVECETLYRQRDEGVFEAMAKAHCCRQKRLLCLLENVIR